MKIPMILHRKILNLLLIINKFLHYFNLKILHSTTNYVPKDDFFNFNNEDILKEVVNTEKNWIKF